MIKGLTGKSRESEVVPQEHLRGFSKIVVDSIMSRAVRDPAGRRCRPYTIKDGGAIGVRRYR
jgi:hypothetical protein